MNKIWCNLKNYKLHIILGPIFKMLEAMFELFVPIVMADIIDNGINGETGGVEYILIRCGVLVALAFIGFGCSITCQYLASRCSEGFAMLVRRDMFQHIARLSQSDIDRFGTSSLVVRLNNDVATLENGVVMSIRLLTRSPFLVIGSTVMAFIIDWKIAIIFVVIIPLLFLAFYLVLSHTIPMYGKVQAKLDKTGSMMRDSVAGVKVVRAFGREQAEEEKFNVAVDDLQDNAIKVGKISAILNPATLVIINLAIVVTLYFSGKMVNIGQLTTGEVVALVNYLIQISVALEMLVKLILSYTKAFASYKRIKEVLYTEPSLTNGDKTANDIDIDKPIISFDNVCFGYQNAGVFAENYDFDINAGEFVGIIGATGSGKTTILRMLNRSYDVLSGKVAIGGVNIKEFKAGEIAKLISVCSQKAVLFSGSIRENLKFRNENATDEELYEALHLADAYDFVMAGNGLDSHVAKGGSNYSGGQRQRLSIARALVGDSKILVFDDSTSALDFATEATVLSNIKKSRPNQAKILISLRANSIKNADKIIVLDHGKIVGIGTHSELIESCSEYAEIYYSQNDEEVAL